MWTKFYEIRQTDEYGNADSVYTMLPINRKYKIKPLVSKEVYTALIFRLIYEKEHTELFKTL